MNDYFASVRDAFERAASLGTGSADVRRYYSIGPDTFCLRFAGDALVPTLTAALAHREIPAAAPTYTILCCDDAAIKAPLLPRPWRAGDKQIATDIDENIRSFYAPRVPCLNLFNTNERVGIYWIEHGGKLPIWERSLPFRHLLHWSCRDVPQQMVHAAAVGMKNGGVLLTGKGGSGKSTTALACLNSSLEVAGDDYVLITTEPEPYVYSVYNTAKLVPDNLAMLPHLANKVSNADALADEKALFFLKEHYPEKLSAGFPLKAIFLPRVTHERATRLTPAKGIDVLLALAPTTLSHLDGDRKLALDKMSSLARALPHYWLELGTDLERVPAVIADFLEKTP